MKKKWYHYIKDVIIYAIIVGLLYLAARIYFKDVKEEAILEHITQYVGTVVTILFGMIGILEFAYDNGLHFLVPTSYISYKESKLRKQTKDYLEDFFSKENEYFSQHTNSRITYLLNQLGLSHNQLDDLKISILAIKLMPLRSLEDAKNKLKEVLKTPNIILCQDNKATDDLVYKNVKYFINFTDIMFVEDYRKQITDSLAFLIKQITQENKYQYNRIAIPHSSNFLLGYSISESLNTALVKVTEKPMILKSKSWIGNFEENKENHTIMVHDVLVSGKQIKESIRIIENYTKIEALFCLVSRFSTEEKVKFEKEEGIPIFSLLDLDDSSLEGLIK